MQIETVETAAVIRRPDLNESSQFFCGPLDNFPSGNTIQNNKSHIRQSNKHPKEKEIRKAGPIQD